MRGRKTQVERRRIAVGYCRVSTREQATEGHSLAAQESRLQALAQAQGVTIDRVFVDAGCSGKNLKRQAVAELLAAIAAGSISALYICKLDRLCRNLEDLLAIVRLCGKHDVALVSASEAIDTGSPAGKMMLSMLGAFAEFERAQIAARISDVSYDLRSKRQVYCGGTPFGYTRQGSSLVPDPTQQQALASMRRMHAEGASYRQIASWATQNGIRAKGRMWYASSVRDVLLSKMSAMEAA
jgi:site-specific DNA recombinase